MQCFSIPRIWIHWRISSVNSHDATHWNNQLIVDKYYTIKEAGSSQYKEKMSRFLSFALPVSDAAECKSLIKEYQNKYHDARHVCWAYMLGPERQEWQLNDNGEPSGTAGKPILGQINSLELTDVLVIVVRYFGGIKLGTPGLIAAYREAARLGLEAAGKIEKRQMRRLRASVPYAKADGVMKILKSMDVRILDQTFDNMCGLLVEYPLDLEPELMGRLESADECQVESV